MVIAPTFGSLASLDVTTRSAQFSWRGKFSELQAAPDTTERQAQKSPTGEIGLIALCTENPQLGWGFRKAFSFEPVIKTPFDLLKHLAVWQLQVSNKKSKGGPNGERKELSAHPIEL
ncbi:TPA: hypothetical protein ACJFTT_004712 [Escherichia coli]